MKPGPRAFDEAHGACCEGDSRMGNASEAATHLSCHAFRISIIQSGFAGLRWPENNAPISPEWMSTISGARIQCQRALRTC
eukprot:2663109-Pyramimonas_sp.AAC.1